MIRKRRGKKSCFATFLLLANGFLFDHLNSREWDRFERDKNALKIPEKNSFFLCRTLSSCISMNHIHADNAHFELSSLASNGRVTYILIFSNRITKKLPHSHGLFFTIITHPKFDSPWIGSHFKSFFEFLFFFQLNFSLYIFIFPSQLFIIFRIYF